MTADPLRLHDPGVLEQLRREDVAAKFLIVAAYATYVIGVGVGLAGAIFADDTNVVVGVAVASVLTAPLFLPLVWRIQRRLRQLRAAVLQRLGLTSRTWRAPASIALLFAVGIALTLWFHPAALLVAALGTVVANRTVDPASPRWVTAVELAWLSVGAAALVAGPFEADQLRFLAVLVLLTLPTGLPATLVRAPVLRAAAAGSRGARRLVPLLPVPDRVRALREGGDPAGALQRALGCLAASLVPSAVLVREAGLSALAAGDRDLGCALLGGVAWAAPGDSVALIAIARTIADDDPVRALAYARLAESVSGRRLRGGAPEAQTLREQLEQRVAAARAAG